MEWGVDASAEQRRRMQRAMIGSLVGHALLVVFLLLAPTPSPPPLMAPPALSVKLMAALPAPTQASKPAPAPAPVPVARPKPKVKILPKKAPAVTAKARKKPQPEPEVVRRKPRPKEMAPADAMEFLRQTAGEDSEPLLKAPEVAASASSVTSSSATSEGTRVATEADKFALEVRRAIRPHWRLPDDLRRERGTLLEVHVGPDGRLVSPPRILISSGNPYYDDNAIRALERTPVLPRPPRPGPIQIFLTPEEPG